MSSQDPTPDKQTLDDAVTHALGQELLRISRRRVLVPDGAKLDQSAYRILWVLTSSGPLSMGELGEVLQLEQSTISRQVSAATRQGLVTQSLQEGSTRRLVVPTPEGQEAYRWEAALRGEQFRRAIEQLGSERARRLSDDLRDFNDAMDRVRSGPEATASS